MKKRKPISIIQKEKECYVCGTTRNLHLHHIFFGRGNRDHSETYGLKVYLCYVHHEDNKIGVHGNRELREELERIGQAAFEKEYPEKDFRKIFGKNYL